MNAFENAEKLKASAANAILNLRLAITQMGINEAHPVMYVLEQLISDNESNTFKPRPKDKNKPINWKSS